MTPEEKAKNLVWKFLPIIDGWTGDDKTEIAKQCALIAVNEVINFSKNHQFSIREDNIFWQQVKEHINKL